MRHDSPIVESVEHLLTQCGPLTVKELATLSGYSLSAISKSLELLELRRMKDPQLTGGRPAMRYALQVPR